MSEELSGLAVKVTPDNMATLKLLRTSIPTKPYVVYRVEADKFIAVTSVFSCEKLIPSFDKLNEFKLLISLGMSSNSAYTQTWVK